MTVSARIAPVSTSKPAPKRTWRSKDQRVLYAGYDREAGVDPRFRTTLENRNLPAAGFEQTGGHAGARARLADQNRGKIETEVVEARFDLVQRNVDRARDVAGSEFAAGTHVHEQGRGGWVISQFRDADRGTQVSSYIGKSGSLGKRIQEAGIAITTNEGMATDRRGLSTNPSVRTRPSFQIHAAYTNLARPMRRQAGFGP